MARTLFLCILQEVETHAATCFEAIFYILNTYYVYIEIKIIGDESNGRHYSNNST